MLTPEQIAAARRVAFAIETAIAARVSDEREVARQRQALTVFRHAHALRIALDGWDDDSAVGRGGADGEIRID